MGERENAYKRFEQIKKLSTTFDEVFNGLSTVASSHGTERLYELQRWLK